MKHLLVILAFLATSFLPVNGQIVHHVELGLTQDSSYLYFNWKTNFDIDPTFDIMTQVVTVKWKTTQGVVVDAPMMDWYDPVYTPLSNYWFSYNPLVTDGTYSYQTFVTSGWFLNSNIYMDSAVVYPMLKVPYYNSGDSCVMFEVVDDVFQESINCSWWCSILYPPMSFPNGGVDATYPTFMANRYINGMQQVVDGDCVTSVAQQEYMTPPTLATSIADGKNVQIIDPQKQVTPIVLMDISGKVISVQQNTNELGLRGVGSGLYLVDLLDRDWHSLNRPQKLVVVRQ